MSATVKAFETVLAMAPRIPLPSPGRFEQRQRATAQSVEYCRPAAETASRSRRPSFS
jgi:hypothetical protein